MNLHIVPKDIHERIMALGVDTYVDIFNAATITSVLSVNDIARLCLAHQDFSFGDIGAGLGITLAPSPLECFKQLSDEEGLSEEHPMVDKLKWATELAKSTSPNAVDTVDRYTLVPGIGEEWVVVQQRVHCGVDHPNAALVRENKDFFDQLISRLYYEVGFEGLAKTSLLSHYLESLRHKSDA